jgi:hypothetical protein
MVLTFTNAINNHALMLISELYHSVKDLWAACSDFPKYNQIVLITFGLASTLLLLLNRDGTIVFFPSFVWEFKSK